MIKKLAFLFCLFSMVGCVFSTETLAQTSKKKKKFHKPAKRDMVHIKAPSIKAKKPVTVAPKPKPESNLDPEKALLDSILVPKKQKDYEISLYRELSIVNEDTSTFDEGEVSTVEVSEEVKVDSTWVRIAEYYSIWDSKRINPYHIERDEFDSPIWITLYDTTKGQYWAMPHRKTHINSRFGFRGYRFHFGTDLELDIGDTIRAPFDGIVRAVGYDGRGYGNYIVVRHYNGFETLFGHLSRIDVESQQIVKANETLGMGGSTGRSSGPHLHYEVRYQGNAIDTELLYDYDKWAIKSDKFYLTPAAFKYTFTRSRKVMYHRIRPNDTFLGIARKYGVSMHRLFRLNHMNKNSHLRAGRRLRIK
jgi:murein DD-endopeptidase MepM/ murein hydrolase activator NlpD